MHRYSYWGCLFLVLLIYSLASGTEARGAVRVASSCSSTNVQTEINASVSNDTVQLPGPCSATWNPASISIPSSKGITLDGRGAVITRGAGSDGTPMISIAANRTVSTRITNFSIFGSNVNNQGHFLSITTDTAGTDALFRIDHVNFDGDSVGVHIKVHGPGYGLIDHCSFAWNGNNEIIHALGYGPSNNTGWGLDITPGSLDALYIEDNVFLNRSVPNYLGGKILMVYGAKEVVRFNTFTRVTVDVHGNTPPSGRYWEFYHNTFLLNSGDNVDKWYQIRGGTGFIFGDSAPSIGNGGRTLTFWEEDSGNPARDQIGRGKNQNSTPAYVWLKDPNMSLGIDDSACGGCIIANNSYYIQGASFNGTSGVGVGTIASRPSTCTAGVAYWATDEGEWWAANAGPDGQLYKCTAANTWTLYYTPATYPHPSQSGGTDTAAPAPPTNLRVS